jgi:glutaminyl-peptide cyclotransferase
MLVHESFRMNPSMARLRRKRASAQVSRKVATNVGRPIPPSPSRRWVLIVALVLVSLGTVGGLWWLLQLRNAPVFGYRVVNTFPHDPQAFTQGLIYDDGFLLESTGKYGESTLRRVELESGRVLQMHSLSEDLFGEGITVFGDRIYQLTWRNGVAIVYDKQTFEELGRFRYDGEGWGLTDDGTHLIMSDGSATLRFIDPEDFQVVRRLLVRSQGRRVDRLNELQYIHGQIFANILYQDRIARISPETGEVTGWVDLRTLWPGRRDREAVLNGIAYDQQNDRLFVTGKNWPRLYEIRLTRR